MNGTINPEVIYALWREDFGAFFEKAFAFTHGNKALDPGWHLDAMIYAAEQLLAGKTPRLCVALPPGHMKSMIFSVALPAWALGRNPATRILCASHSMDLAERNARMFREVIESDWYRATFPEFKISPKCDKAALVVTTKGGNRMSASVNTSVTGIRTDLIVVDDPLPAEHALSDAYRNHSNQWFDRSIENRLDDKENGPIAIVMQRLHLDDLIGHVLLRDEKWRYLALPAIAEVDEEIPISAGQFHSRKIGEVLCPARESLAFLLRKKQADSFMFSAQFQQSPIPVEGAMVKRAWFKRYDKVPSRNAFDAIVQSWDCAGKAQMTSDFSAGLTFGVKGDEYHLLDVLKGRWDYPDLRKKVLDYARMHRPTTVLIEDTMLGSSLLQDFRRTRELRAIGVPVKAGYDKITRLQHQSAKIEQGQLFLPVSAPWLVDFENELIRFPGSKYDDVVDALSQFLRYEQFRKPPMLECRVTLLGGPRRLVQYSTPGF